LRGGVLIPGIVYYGACVCTRYILYMGLYRCSLVHCKVLYRFIVRRVQGARDSKGEAGEP
jgi:hypothetical protein